MDHYLAASSPLKDLSSYCTEESEHENCSDAEPSFFTEKAVVASIAAVIASYRSVVAEHITIAAVKEQHPCLEGFATIAFVATEGFGEAANLDVIIELQAGTVDYSQRLRQLS